MYQGSHSGYFVIAERRRARARKRTALIASLAMVGVLAIGGTIAWMTSSTSSVVNTFSPGRITTEVEEDIDNGVKSDVKVENTGTVKAYIRATVVVNWVDANGRIAADRPVLGVDYSMGTNASQTGNPNAWFIQDGYYYWPSAVEPSAMTGVLIESCQPVVQKSGYRLQVEVLASGIQALPDNVVTSEWGVNVSNDILVPTMSDAGANE